MKPLLSELFLPCSGKHSPMRANRYPLTTITGAQRASGQTHSRARSHQDGADLRADRSTAYLVSCIRVCSAHGNSFDHLVGAQQECFGYLQAEHPGSRQIDDEIEFSWLLNWNVRWFCPAQDPVDHLRRAAVQTRKVWPVRHQAASLDILSYAYHCRQARSQCQNDDAHAMHVQHRVAGDIDCICMSLERLKRGHDILALPDLRRNNLKAEPARYRLNLI